MSEEIYRKLAQRLDAIPNGFPATESGVELKLLAKIFSPEEAALAAVMRLSTEPAAVIAGRAGLDPKTALRLLKTMVRQGQIEVRKENRELVFRLMPFVVGIYEEQLPRMDAELAALFEAYFQETRGMSGAVSPSVHRVIPVAQAVSFDTEIYPLAQASALVEAAQAWGVRECICRLQQKLIGKGCDHPLENCLVFAPFPGVFDHSESTRAITKAEALTILQQAASAGLIHSVANQRDDLTYICNCCTCCCGVARSVVEFGLANAIAHSDFYAVVDEDQCLGCGDCVTRCHFEAITLPGDTAEVAYARCVGCGQCVAICSGSALSLARRPAEDIAPLPADHQAWLAQRAQNRHLNLEEVL